MTLSSILLLVVLLMPDPLAAAGSAEHAQAQREALLQRAVDASTEERRRIAGALHDGVVQDLAATSFTVAGAAERAESVRPAGGWPTTCAAPRRPSGASIGGLRSLLVDIYPPAWPRAGLRRRWTTWPRASDQEGSRSWTVCTRRPGWTSAGERLVFRVAQECLTQHRASRCGRNGPCQLRSDRQRTASCWRSTDDGVGFDAGNVLAHPEEGHFGLRILGDVVAEAGAELWLASAPGVGTAWQLRVPLS